MNDTKNQPGQPGIPAASNTPSGRRRFVRGVGVSVPVILTAVSRSTLAAQCLSPSASASISLLNSRPLRTPDGSCLGKNVAYWQATTETIANTQFESVFTGGFAGSTMKQVAALNGVGDPNLLGAHLAAAWCNWSTGRVTGSVIDDADLIAMWNDTVYGIGYKPVASGPVWTASEIVTYLQSTMLG